MGPGRPGSRGPHQRVLTTGLDSVALSEIEPTQLHAGPRAAPRRRHGTGRITVERARLAEDAAGRVELLVLHAPADVLEPADPVAAAPERPVGRFLTALMHHDGWLAVGILGAALVLIFVIGLWLTH